MTDLKQRLSEKRDELAERFTKSKNHERDPYCEQGYYHPMRKGFNAGFDILAPQIIELVQALELIKSESCKGDETTTELSCHYISDEALEKFNKFLGEK
jgi:hypothetical protein